MKRIIVISILLTCVLILNRCKKGDSGHSTLTIGQSYQGGKIAYILKQGDTGYDTKVQHGIIAAPSDQSTGIVWYYSFPAYCLSTGATGSEIGSGLANTNAIIANQGNDIYAAKLCHDLVLGGFSDWYLPSYYELNELYLNKISIGGFADQFYWSSSEYSDCNARICNFYNGLGGTVTAKFNKLYVRAIRSF